MQTVQQTDIKAFRLPSLLPLKINTAIGRGLVFLSKKQARDGSFSDFSTQVGMSNTWITAHIAWVLEDVRGTKEIRRSAARYLMSVRNSDGTWGYNSSVSGDLDSTAQALMVLQRNNLKIEKTTLGWIAKHQLIDGSFPTYPPVLGMFKNGWAQGHPEVTLNILELFRRMNVYSNRRKRGLKWLREISQKEALNSYWWPRPGYMVWTLKKTNNRHLFEESYWNKLLDKRPIKAPELPMILNALVAQRFLCSNRGIRAIASLTALQRLDGSWDCAPCLRVTQRSSLSSLNASGSLHAGKKRLFSTAHAIGALAAIQKVYQKLSVSSPI
jgi:hypothetical protein